MIEDGPSFLMDSTTNAGALKLKFWMLGLGALLLALLPDTAAQPGFVSIDCGSNRSYKDERGIAWSTDDGYTATGTNQNVTVPSDLSRNGNPVRKQLSTARHFDASRKRHCYIIPNVISNASYLIRLSFLYGDIAPLPVGYAFQLSIDSSVLGTYSLEDDAKNEVTTVEYFVASRSEEIAVCLLTKIGKPFISSLELRPLAPETFGGYMFNSKRGSLADRLDCGSDSSAVPIRYPDDKFDRIWYTDANGIYSISLDPSVTWNLGSNRDDVSLGVVQTAWEANGWYEISVPTQTTYFVSLYFAELNRNLNATDRRVVNVTVNGVDIAHNYTIAKDGSLQLFYDYIDVTGSVSVLNFTLEPDPSSTLPPLLNAYEIHAVRDADGNATASVDRQAVDDVRVALSFTDWSGDPCFPVSFDWLTCDGGNPAVVTQIKLSNTGLNGTIPPSMGALSSLTDLWLDGNFITGSIPDLRGLTALQTLHLQNNSMTGPIPETLAGLPLLKELFLQNNHFDGAVPAALASKNGLNLTVDSPSGSNSGSNSSSSSDSGSKGTPIGVIVGAIAGVAVVIFVLGILACGIRRRRKNAESRRDTKMASDQRGHHAVLPMEGGSVQSTKAFSLAEVIKITNNYEQQIGEGGFGPVYYGKLANGSEVAVKVNSETSGQGRDEFVTEVSLLSRIHHRNLVHLIGFCDEGDKRILIYDFLEEGALRDHLYGRGLKETLDWPTRLRIAIDAARGLEYLHNDCHPRIIHRDVKSNNILLDNKLQGKMTDFGISKSNGEGQTETFTSVKGSTGYLDPEYFISTKLTYKSDVYAFGVVLLEIISGQAPFGDDRLTSEGHWKLMDYVRQMLSEGRIEMVADRSLRDNYNKEAMWKVAELAMRCVEPLSINRPDIREVVKELSEASQYGEEMESVTSQFGNRDTTQTFRQNSFSGSSPANPNFEAPNYPSYQPPSSANGSPMNGAGSHDSTGTEPLVRRPFAPR